MRSGGVTAVSLTLALGVLIAPLAVDAQQTRKVWRIGYLSPGSVGVFGSFRLALRELGYIEGENLLIESRLAQEEGRLRELAAELVRLPVDVLVTRDTTGALAAKQVTTSTPIVMVLGSDPVASGLVASLAQPGGNVTGVTALTLGLSAKRVELLRETVPGVSRLGVLRNRSSPFAVSAFRETQAAAQKLGLRVYSLEVSTPADFGAAFTTATREHVEGFICLTDAITWSQRTRIVNFTAKERLPAIYEFREFVELGGLMSYGASFPALWQRAAYFVDRILKGAKPADLPVEQASKFELILNLRTATALGLTIPQSVLLRADEVIR